MSGLEIFYLACVLVAGIGLICIEAWGKRHDRGYTPVTLLNLFQGLGLALCPIINFFTTVGVIVYFFAEIAPNIILFGKKTP